MLDLDRLGAEHGARTAIDSEGGRIGYAELGARVGALRSELAERGVVAGEGVALACPAEPEAISRALAFLSHGCPLLPLDPAATEAEIERYARAFGASWGVGPSGEPKRLAEAPAGSDGAAPCLAFLSSGASGAPKLVLRTRVQETAAISIFGRTLSLSKQDRVLGLVSLGHSFGFGRVLLGTLAAGARLVLSASRHPRDVVERIVRSEATVFAAPPALLDLMARFQGATPRPLDTLRACLSVGESLPQRTFAAFDEAFGVAPWSSYGASEAGSALLNRNGVVDAGGTMALGRPFDGVEVSIVDEAGHAVPEGETGEIVVRSPAVGLGYRGGDDGGSRIEGGRFFTGDLGLRRDGEIHFAGRNKLLIAVAGHKVNPEEVEHALRRHPAVADAAVLARRQGASDGVKALVVLREPVATAELIAFCRASLAAYKVPREVEIREALPRSALGKLLRDRLA